MERWRCSFGLCPKPVQYNLFNRACLAATCLFTSIESLAWSQQGFWSLCSDVQILGKSNIPKKVRNFSNTKFATKQKQKKKTINRLQINKIQWEYSIMSLQNTPKLTFPTFFRTFTPNNNKILTTNWIYDITPYVQLQIWPIPWKFTPSLMVWMVTFCKSAFVVMGELRWWFSAMLSWRKGKVETIPFYIIPSFSTHSLYSKKAMKRSTTIFPHIKTKASETRVSSEI